MRTDKRARERAQALTDRINAYWRRHGIDAGAYIPENYAVVRSKLTGHEQGGPFREDKEHILKSAHSDERENTESGA